MMQLDYGKELRILTVKEISCIQLAKKIESTNKRTITHKLIED
jgi:hypothetical protein